MALVFPTQRRRFVDASGAPYAGYKLHTYVSGTTTNQATYTDAAFTSANANPITLDGNGECVAYLKDTFVYTFELKSAGGASQWVRDDIRSDTFVADGVGSEARRLADKTSELVSVKDFGAVGDGTTDDTAAFQAAVDAGKRVFVPRTDDSYRIDNLVIPSGVILQGEGAASTIKRYTVNTGVDVVFNVGAEDDITIRDLRFEVPSATYPDISVIWGQGCSGILVEDCVIAGGGNVGVHFVNATECVARNVTIDDCYTTGIVLGSVDSGTNVRCRIQNCFVSETATGHGISIDVGRQCIVENNSVRDTAIFGIQLSKSEFCVVQGNTTTDTTREGVNASGSLQCVLSGNTCSWTGSSSDDFGISIAGIDGYSCVGNTVANNSVCNSGKSGIAVSGAQDVASLNHVTGNMVVNCNAQGGESEGLAGVLIFGADASNNHVSDNFVYDANGNTLYGIRDWNGSVGSSIRDNRVIGATGGEVARASSSIEALNGRAPTAWTPTITSATGTITTITPIACSYYELDKLVYLSIDFTITNNGTGAGDVRLTLPSGITSAAHPTVIPGRTLGTTGAMLQGLISASDTSLRIFKYDNAYPGATNARLVLNGFFERA